MENTCNDKFLLSERTSFDHFLEDHVDKFTVGNRIGRGMVRYSRTKAPPEKEPWWMIRRAVVERPMWHQGEIEIAGWSVNVMVWKDGRWEVTSNDDDWAVTSVRATPECAYRAAVKAARHELRYRLLTKGHARAK